MPARGRIDGGAAARANRRALVGRCPMIVVVVVVGALVAVACGGGGGKARSGGSGSEGVASGQAPCPVDALAGAEKPVTIRLWHTQVRANVEELERQVARFHAAQGDVRVKLVHVPTYEDMLAKYKAGLESGSGDLPDVGQFEETSVQTLLDSRSTVSMQSCVDRDGYPLDDFLPRTISYYSVDGKLVAMPWVVSNPILVYDAAAFRRAGLDPAEPPRTLDEVEAYARRIVDAGVATHGISLQVFAYIPENIAQKSGQSLADHDDGRAGRARRALLDNPVNRAVWTWWHDLVRSGLALDTGDDPTGIDHLLAIGTGDSAMTIDGSPVLGPIKEVLESGQFRGVELATAPLPSLEGGGGVPVGDGALWITSRSSPARQAAAWRFVKFLVAPEQITSLATHTGFVPIRRSSVRSAAVQRFWREHPEFKVPYDQLVAPGAPSADGAVIGDYEGVREAVRDGIVEMLGGGRSPAEALRRAQVRADAAIRGYNERVGG